MLTCLTDAAVADDQVQPMCMTQEPRGLSASLVARGNTISHEGRASIVQFSLQFLGLPDAAHPMNFHFHTFFRESQILYEVTAQKHLPASGTLAVLRPDGGDVSPLGRPSYCCPWLLSSSSKQVNLACMNASSVPPSQERGFGCWCNNTA